MRDIYSRHRIGCASATKDDHRTRFKCGCPIYGRIKITDPVTGDVLFEHNGSLSKYGVSTREAAAQLVDSWAVQYLTGAKPPVAEQRASLTVSGAVEAYIAYKQSRGKTPETIRKLDDILTPLIVFCQNRGISYLKDVDFDTLVAFEYTWKGKCLKDPVTGKERSLEKSATGKQKYQDVLRMFLRHWHNHGKISINPGASLEAFSTPPAEIHVYTPHQIVTLFAIIPEQFPKIAPEVETFLWVQLYSALRISDMVTLEVNSVSDEEGFAKNQIKTRNGVYCALPHWVIAKLRTMAPRSPRYFFWSGGGQIETAAKDWSAKLLKLFRAAGVPEGYRSHAFRDTMATTILENGGTLEDAQIALGHRSRKTTEKYYTAVTKRRSENVNRLKKTMWESDPLYKQMSASNMVSTSTGV